MAETAPALNPQLTAEDEVVDLCAAMVRFDTTNFGGGQSRGERHCAEWVAERLTEAGLEPVLLESAPGRANVVARIAGTDPTADALLVHGHLDVVPAVAEDWSRDPFAGEVHDGFLWGRGTVDMKDACASTLAVVRDWARTGRRPRRDLVLAFLADEEDTGAYGSYWLVEQHPELFEGCTEAISESGGFSLHATDSAGRPRRIYPIAVGERGSSWMKLTSKGTATHGSRTTDDNAVTKLCAAMARVGEYRWPIRLTDPVRALLTGAGQALGVEVDLESEEGLARTLGLLGDAGSLGRFTVRNSANPTMLQAGYKVNVIPGEAVAHLDGRTLPGYEEEFLRTLDRLLGPDVTREYVNHSPPVCSPLATATFEAMARALRAEDPEAHVVPFVMAGGTDAKAFARLGIAGYGYSPIRTPVGFDYYNTAHGVDERVPVDGLRFGVRALDRFLSDC